MVLCICRGVTEAEILDAIRRGAWTLDKVARRCDGAGADCGSCRADIQDHIDQARRPKGTTPTATPYPPVPGPPGCSMLPERA